MSAGVRVVARPPPGGLPVGIETLAQQALAGAKPDQAFFVNVGLGTTMTAQDILEGRMNVEIGMAVVRPAEFIILKFSHKMQES